TVIRNSLDCEGPAADPVGSAARAETESSKVAMAAAEAGRRHIVGLSPSRFPLTTFALMTHEEHTAQGLPAHAQSTGVSGPPVWSVRLVAADGDAMAVAVVGVVVPDRPVLDAPVIPERHRVGPPPEAHAECRRLDVPIEHLEHGGALVLGEADNLRREQAVDE